MHALKLEQPESTHDQLNHGSEGEEFNKRRDKGFHRRDHVVSTLICSQTRIAEMEAILLPIKVKEKSTEIIPLKSLPVP